MPPPPRLGRGAPLLAAGLLAAACAALPGLGDASDPQRYRLGGSGTHWDVAGEDRVLEDLRPRYPDFFAVILDPGSRREPEVRRLRRHLEKRPVDRRNFDALNAVAIAYFEINYRGEAHRHEPGGARAFLSEGQRAAKLAAIPWRAYMEVEDDGLRSAILDFYADAATGEKLGSTATANRLVEVVASLKASTEDAERRRRIERIVAALRETAERAHESGRHVVPSDGAPEEPGAQSGTH